ncbi:MAG TPA: hypothetical protein VF345_11925 [Chthoniobacterales bacterium]
MGGSWFDPNNWDNGVSGDNTCAFIDDGGVATVDSGHAATAQAQRLYLGYSQGDSGSVVVDGADLDVEYYYPYPDCYGPIYVGNHGRGTLTIDNGRTVYARYVYIAAAANQTGRNSNGTVTVEGGASLLVNPGECSLAGGAQICIGCDANGNDGGTAVLNIKDATVEVDNLAAEGVLPPGVTVGPSGTLKGNSVLTLTGTTSLSQTASVLGTLAPSGTLTIKGNLDLTANDTSNSANTICHVTPTANDSVEVSDATGGGQVTLGGRITVIMSGSFTQGSRFTLVHAAGGRNHTRFRFYSIISLSGSSGSCITPTITYDDYNVYLSLESCASVGGAEDP